MAKRVATIARKTPCENRRNQVCDDCAFGTWNTWTDWNFDAQGKPITLRCPHYKEGKFGIVRGSQACHNFVARNPTSE